MNKLLFSTSLLFFSITASANITETTLDNGLKIIIKEDHRSPVMVSQIWYKVGSSYEHGGITGLSHMLEHMMFKGTKKLGINEFSKIIAENGGRENAFTGRDYTAYFQRMEKSRYPISFKLEADRMRNLLLDEKEFTKERDVVVEERRMRTDDNPQALTYENFFSTAFASSPYHHPIIGWENDIKHHRVKDLKAWYKKWYAPNNATLVVAGDVDPKAVIAEAKKHFGPLKPSLIDPPKPQVEIACLGEKSIKIHAPAKVPMLILGFLSPSLLTAKIKWEPYALEVLAYVLDGGNSSRINKSLIREKKIATSAGVSYDPTNRLQTLFILQGSPSKDVAIEELKAAFLDEIEKLQTTLATPEELQRIKTQLLASKIYERDSVFYQAMQIGRLETIGLSWRDAENFTDKLQLVTAEQIQAVAKKYLDKKNLIAATLIPETTTEKKDDNVSK